MPRRKVSYRPVRYLLRRTNINSLRSRDQPSVKEGTNRLQDQNDSMSNHNKAGNSYPINNILVLPQNSETLINVISPNSKNFSFKKVLKKLNSRRRKEKQRLKKGQAKTDIKPDITKLKQNMKSTINRHTIILSDSEDETIKNEPKNASSDKSIDDDVILVEVNKPNEIIEIEDSCNDDLNNSKTECVDSQYKTTERNELLSTPESTTSNDFLENSQPSNNSNFNFSLHGSEFKDSEFLKPSVPVDVSESGSVSSVSDVSSIKANVFNVVDFPKEKENLFDENSLEKFKDSITPQRKSLRDDVNPSCSKDGQNNLPTLSHIQTDDSQLRKVRGRSIIRELVNDRAYVLLASAEKKIKKKRKSRDEAEISTLDSDNIENASSDSIKKKKKRKKRKDNEDDTYCQFTEDVDMTNISSPMKNTKEKHKIAVNIEDTNQQFNLEVRNDLFSEIETDTSISTKKTKKKDKDLEEIEHKKKNKKNKKQADETPEVLDTTKKRKKEKSLSECSNNESYEIGKNKTKKKKRKTDSDDHLLQDDDTTDQIEVSEVNEVIIPIKHQKKTNETDGLNEETTISQGSILAKSGSIEIGNNPIVAKNIEPNVASGSETRFDIVFIDSDTKMILNELPEPPVDPKDVVEIHETEENIDSKKIQEIGSDSVIDNDDSKKKDTENPADKSRSVWNMCSSNFFASSESLFVVSDVRTVTETEYKPEVIQAPECVNSTPSEPEVAVSEMKNSAEESQVSETPVEQVMTPPNGGNEELKPQESDDRENPNEGTSEKLPIEVKQEETDPQIDPGQDMEVLTLGTPPTDELTIKQELVEETQKSDVVTIISSPFLSASESTKPTEAIISPDVIKTIIEEKDNIKSVTKLCEFLEEAKDPSDVLRKVSMIKQAFLAESTSSEIIPPIQPTINDDIFSISDSESDSVMCIEEETTCVDIQDDISLANCNVTVVVPDDPTGVSDQNPPEEINEIIINANVGDPIGLRCGEVGNYAKTLDKYEVEAIQSGMRNDPKLWQISSDDLPSNRRIVKNKRCIKCKEIGHLVMNCPNKNALPKCYLCGLEGHADFKCPNKLCTKCGSKSTSMQSHCKQCKHYGRIICSLCTMRGHPRNKCPDLWRRYHSTVNDGPLVETTGMKLKKKEDLWCSSCAKRGHLEYYCYMAMKNRNFQQLDPRIHHYEDVYKAKSDVTKSGGVISQITLQEIQNYVTTPGKSKNIDPKANTPSEVSKEIVQAPVAPLEDPQVHAELDLPPGFVVVDEVTTEPGDQSLLNVGTSMDDTNGTIVDKPMDNTPNLLDTPKNSPPADEFQSIQNFTASPIPSEDLFITDIDMKAFFMHADIDLIKKFLTKELRYLETFSVKIKDMFFKYHVYDKDSQKALNERDISIGKHRRYVKQLNMLIFGKEHLKSGHIRRLKLEFFVKNPTGFFTDAMRESLYSDYDYIFGDKKHEHTQYGCLLKLLMDKYGYRKKQK